MSGSAALVKDLQINTLAVVANSQSKLAPVVDDVHFDSPGVGVTEGVAKRFDRYPIDLVPDQRSQLSRCAFYLYAKGGSTPDGLIGNEALCERADGGAKLVVYQRGG